MTEKERLISAVSAIMLGLILVAAFDFTIAGSRLLAACAVAVAVFLVAEAIGRADARPRRESKLHRHE